MPTDVETTSTEVLEPAISAPAAGDPRTSASVRTPLGQLTNRARWLWARVEEVIGKFAPIAGRIPKPLTGSDATADTLTLVGHGLSNNDPIAFVSVGGGLPPNPISLYTGYYAIVVDADTFKVSASSGPGAAVNITGSLSGSVYVKTLDSTSGLWLYTNAWKPIQTAIDQIVGELATFASLAGNNTMTGDNTFSGKTTYSGTGGYIVLRAGSLANADQTITGTDNDVWNCPDVSANRTTTVNNPSEEGETFSVVRTAGNATSGLAMLFKSVDTTTIGRLPSPGSPKGGAIRFVAIDAGGGLKWHAAEWSGDADQVT